MCRVVRHTMQALPSGQMTNTYIKTLLGAVVLMVLAVPAYGQGTAIVPCQDPPKVQPRARLHDVDASVPADPAVEKMLAPYSAKVRELSKVIGRLEGGLKRSGVG